MQSLKIGDLVQNNTNPLEFGVITGEVYSPDIIDATTMEKRRPNSVFLVHWFTETEEENFYPAKLLTKVKNGTG